LKEQEKTSLAELKAKLEADAAKPPVKKGKGAKSGEN
jgi:hypothetical protein